MSYCSFNQIASDLAMLCHETNLFKDIRKAMCASHGQVLDVIDTVSDLPSAIVTVYGMKYSRDKAFREVDAAIIALMPFENSNDSEHLPSLTLLDIVAGLFEPQKSLRETHTLNRAMYTLSDITPVMLPNASCVAYTLTFNISCPVTFNLN